jgi:hypothetical protein
MRLLDSQSRIPELAKPETAPEGLDWDRWIGPAEYHPYSPYFTPGRWRAWTPFGTGTPGDWGCHLLDPVYDALSLRAPRRITAEITPGWDPVGTASSFQNASRIRYEFDLPNGRTLTVLWHDGEFCNECRVPRPLEDGRSSATGSCPSSGAPVRWSTATSTRSVRLARRRRLPRHSRKGCAR